MPDKPRRRRRRPIRREDAYARPDALRVPLSPDIPLLGSFFSPSELRAPGPRVPEVRPPTKSERVRTALASAPDYANVAGRAIAELPLTIARDVSRSRNPDELLHALTGVGLSMDPNSPAARPSDARGGRINQAIALGASLLPELGAIGRIGRADRALVTGLRNAERYAERSRPGLREFESVLARQDPRTVPAFERAGGRTRTFNDIVTFTPGGFNQTLPRAIQEGLDAGGFTLDRSGKPFSGSGFMVADSRLTRTISPGEPDAIVRFLASPRVQAELEQPGRYIGGWRDPATGQIEINVSRHEPNLSEAVTFARKHKQKAIGEFKDGAYVGDREFINAPAVIGVDGVTYRGINHGEARESAARALRATPEGRALMQKNGGNAVTSENARLFEMSGGDIISANDPRAANVARAAGQAPTLAPEISGLHSSDLYPGQSPNARIPPGGSIGRPALPKPQEPHFSILSTSDAARKLSDALLADESALLTKRTTPAFEAAGQTLARPEVFGAGALAGAAKMGWFENSARALSETFGPDAPRFAALLAALSPQQSVSSNLRSALDVWEVWNATGRPTESKTIERLINEIARKTESGGELPARIPNSVRALTADDPSALTLSGPKVFNFHRNLIGDAQRVTLDTWMAKLAGTRQSKLSRSAGGVSKASPFGLAYAGRVRQTADYLKRATGHNWTPAEVQETLWSWGKALSETADPATRGVHPSQLDLIGKRDLVSAIPDVTPAKIRGAPDFATLMNEAPFTESIQRQGLPLPIPRSPIPPANLPPPERSFLEILARNMERAQNERGALGGPRTILRVENEAGVGPYQGGGIASGWYMGSDPSILDRQPLLQAREWTNMPWEKQRDYKFGFRDLAQLKRWFTDEELQKLAEAGYRVQPYDAPRHIYDRTQAVFPANLARRANATPLVPPPEGNAALPMLGISGGAALGGLTLWEMLRSR